MRPVVDLLVEQIECADYVILNKIDQLDAAQLESLKGIASSLNPLSRVSKQQLLQNCQALAWHAVSMAQPCKTAKSHILVVLPYMLLSACIISA